MYGWLSFIAVDDYRLLKVPSEFWMNSWLLANLTQNLLFIFLRFPRKPDFLFIIFICQLGQQQLLVQLTVVLLWMSALENYSLLLPTLCSSPSSNGDAFSSLLTVHVSASSRHTAVSLEENEATVCKRE